MREILGGGATSALVAGCRRIVEETLAPGAKVSEVARPNGFAASLVSAGSNGRTGRTTFCACAERRH
jgi:hypothetical protein